MVVLEQSEDRLRKLIRFKEEVATLKQNTSENEDYYEIYNDILEQYLLDFLETLDFHIEDTKEEIVEATEIDEDNDFIITEEI